jgi:hypothetical protein
MLFFIAYSDSKGTHFPSKGNRGLHKKDCSFCGRQQRRAEASVLLPILEMAESLKDFAQPLLQ